MSGLDWNVWPVTEGCVENRRPKTSGWEDDQGLSTPHQMKDIIPTQDEG